ncbi:MAG: hypothetical protein J1G06_00810 [Oscillospiraceae bacterium]|nr:hypothetical protein [Oscillospiraceae bacterium]
MKGLVLELSNGHFDIVSGSVFSAEGGEMPLLCYEENGIVHIKTDPQAGALYEGRIVIPENFKTESVRISLKRCSVSVCEINTGDFEAELSESSAEFQSVAARRIRLSSGKSNVVIYATPVIAAEFKCGFGSTKIFLNKNSRGYSFDMLCGAGALTLDSKRLERTYKGGTPGGVNIKVTCGLGTVEIHNN